MDENLSVMETCVRVLKAINKRQEPAHDDVRILRKFAADIPNGDLDELACAAIQKALQFRAASRRTWR